jgi:HK97 family phage major capsid protein
MADENKLDLKDIQQIVEEGLKTTKANWDKSRGEDKSNFDAKVTNIISEIEEKGYQSKEDVEKAVSVKTSEMEKAITELRKKGYGDHKPKGFKTAVANALKENHDKIKSASNIKGNEIIQLKDISYDSNFPGFEDWRTEVRNDAIVTDREMFHMRDIIPIGATSSEAIKYPRVGEKTGDGPAAWGRGADIATTTPKPTFEPNMSVFTANVEWIAGIMRLPVEMLADLPFLTSFLQNFARQELLEAEDNQLLNGTGASPQLTGLMPNATAYAPGDNTYATVLDQIVDANLRQLGLANTTGTDVILNHAEVVDIVLNKASGSGEYDNPNSVVGYVDGQLQIAGLKSHRTNQIGAGKFLVGNFNHAQIFQRMAPQLRFFEQDRDNVEKNLVTVRIEERLALAILKTTSFIKGDLTPPA